MAAYLLVLLLSASTADLGADSWGRRECAELRLRTLGPCAWPALLAVADSGDAEVRYRAERLLVPYRSLRADHRARSVLLAPWPPPAVEFYHDRILRERVRRVALADGHAGRHVEDLVPDERYSWWCETLWKPEVAIAALAACRRLYGVEPPWWEK